MSGVLLDRRERKILDVMFHSEAKYESNRESFHYSPLNDLNAFRLFLGGCTNDLCGTRRRVEWMLTPLLSVPLAVVDPWGGHG